MPPHAPNVCNTPACQELATALNASMHDDWRKMDPCQEWDKFVCHGYRTKNVLMDGQYSTGIMSELSDQITAWVNDTLHGSFDELSVKMSESHDSSGKAQLSEQQLEDDRRNFHLVQEYFEACTDTLEKEEDDDALNHFLDAIFGGSNETTTAEFNTDGWKSAVTNMSSMGFSAFISIKPDILRPHKPIVAVLPTKDFGMPDYSYYTGQTLQDYSDAITLFLYHVVPWCREDSLKSIDMAAYVLQIERELMRVTTEKAPDAEEGFDLEVMTVKQLAGLLPHLPITAMVQSQLVHSNESMQVEVWHPMKLKEIDSIIALSPPDSMMAYLYWRAFCETPTLWKAQWKGPWDKLKGDMGLPVTWTVENQCAEETMRTFDSILASFFVREKLPQKSVTVINDMFHNIKSISSALLGQTPWFSNTIREELVKKVNAMSMILGYDAKALDLMNSSAVAKQYAGIRIESDGSYPGRHAFVDQYMKNRKWSTLKLWEILGQHPASAGIGFSALVVNAYHFVALNLMGIPAAIAQIPLVGYSFPHVMNYARLGSIIGHEMFHGFDDDRIGPSAQGRLSALSFSTNETAHIQEKHNCIEDLYKDLRADGIGGSRFTIDPKKVLSEAFADIHGGQAAYTAWKAVESETSERMTLPGFPELTAEQLFWTLHSSVWCGTESPKMVDSWGTDVHPPIKFRHWKSVMNSRGWHEAFNCPRVKENCNMFEGN